MGGAQTELFRQLEALTKTLVALAERTRRLAFLHDARRRVRAFGDIYADNAEAQFWTGLLHYQIDIAYEKLDYASHARRLEET